MHGCGLTPFHTPARVLCRLFTGKAFNRNAASPSLGSTKNLLVLHAVEREDRKSGMSWNKFIPGVLHDRTYGKKERSKDVLIAVERRKFLKLLDKVGNHNLFCTYILLEVHKEIRGFPRFVFKQRVLPRKLSLDEYGSISNLGFVRAPHGVKVILSAPVRFRGEEECLGIKEGGLLKQFKRYVSYVCPTDRIPPEIEVDISNLKIGDKVSLYDIKAGVDLYQPEDHPCLVCEIVTGDADVLGAGNVIIGRHFMVSTPRRKHPKFYEG